MSSPGCLATHGIGGNFPHAAQQQQNHLMQRTVRASSGQRTGQDLLALQILNDRIAASNHVAANYNAPQNLQLEPNRMPSFLTMFEREQLKQRQLFLQNQAFALESFKKQQTLDVQGDSHSLTSPTAASLLSGVKRETIATDANLPLQFLKEFIPPSMQQASSQSAVGSDPARKLLSQIHDQNAENHRAVSDVARSPEVSTGQRGPNDSNWLHIFAASQRVDTNNAMFNDELPQLRDQAAATPCNTRQVSSVPPARLTYLPGVFSNDVLIQELWQRRLQLRLQPPPTPSALQTSAGNPFMIQIYGATAARTEGQGPAENLVTLQLLQHRPHEQAQVARSMEENTKLTQYILANLSEAQLRGYPGLADITAKSKETSASFPMEAPSDSDHLSKYQILIRRQLEYFISQKEDADFSVQGRKRQTRLGQVGIRCKHCSHLSHRLRGRGSGYYPAKLSGVYQAAQNMSTHHLTQFCSSIPPEICEQLRALRGGRHDSASGGGKQYWADICQEIGLVEEEDGLRFRSPHVPLRLP